MHFCSKCENMYYLRLAGENGDQLVYYCRNCGNEESSTTGDNVCVSKTTLRRSEQQYTHVLNEYTKLDPTLPRVTNIPCPNADCPTNKSGAKREVIYIRYDDVNVKYVYLCASCDRVWKTSDQK
jgi:DNA-directed RNA polymerase subunit M/transcription elongation factor TFIIS